ncbi:MAG TPA: 50S ribosomal protein L11 methyltransferase [Propylenella sp.]
MVTLKASLTAAFPEARRISNFWERDYGGDGVAVSLDERADGRWSVEAYFENGDAAAIGNALRDRLGADAFGAAIAVELLPDADWVAVGLAALSPVGAGRFIVHGSHDRGRVPAGRVAIEIDAAQAFGTGHHATTAGCLAVLDRLMRRRRFRHVLDLGTGSGLLAIAIAKMLRRPVLAADIDPLAIEAARENARRNGTAHLVRSVVAQGVDHAVIRNAAPFDLVVANILAEPLCRLAPRLSALMARGGVIVLAGLLPEQRGRVVAAYRMQGLKLSGARTFDGWSVLMMRR